MTNYIPSTNIGLEEFCQSPMLSEVLHSLRLVKVTLERSWILVLSTKLNLVFGRERQQPIPGTLLLFHPGTGEYFVTVFSKLFKSGLIRRGSELFDVCFATFSSFAELPCLGWNKLEDADFDPGLFHERCSIRVKGLTASRGDRKVAGRCQACMLPAKRPTPNMTGSIKSVQHCSPNSSKLQNPPAVAPHVFEVAPATTPPRHLELPVEPVPPEQIKTDGDLDCVAQTLGDILAENEPGVFRDIPLDASEVQEEAANESLLGNINPQEEPPIEDIPSLPDTGTVEENEVRDPPRPPPDKENADGFKNPEILEEYLGMWKRKSCDLCKAPQLFQKHTQFELHMFKAHEVKVAECRECGKTFNTRMGGLLKHKKSDHFKGVFHCDYCPAKKLANGKWRYETKASRADDLVEHIQSAHLKPEDATFSATCANCKEKIEFSSEVDRKMDFPLHYQACSKTTQAQRGVENRKRRQRLFKEGKLDSAIACEFCGERFIFRYRYDFHKIRMHTREFPFQCEHCPYATTNQDSLDKHLEAVHNIETKVKENMCEICGLVFRSQYKYRNHKHGNHPAEYTIEKYSCVHCQAGFQTTEQCKEHVLDEHPKAADDVDRCPLCPKIVSRDKRYGFQHHVIAHEDDLSELYVKYLRKNFDIIKRLQDFSSDDGHVTKKALYKREVNIPKICTFCPDGPARKFETHEELHRHCDEMHPGKKEKCQLCDFRAWPSNLKCHVSRHFAAPAEKSWKCDICGRDFLNNAKMQAHRRLHTGEKPYTCGECGARYCSSTSLCNHVNVKHRGKRYGSGKKRERPRNKVKTPPDMDSAMAGLDVLMEGDADC